MKCDSFASLTLLMKVCVLRMLAGVEDCAIFIEEGYPALRLSRSTLLGFSSLI